MESGELFQRVGALVRESQPDHASILGILDPLDQAQRTYPLRELDRAVVLQQQIPGNVTDRRSAGIIVAADGQQKLVMSRRQPDDLGLLLAPVQVLAQTRPQPQETLVIRVLQLKSHHDMTVLHRTSYVR